MKKIKLIFFVFILFYSFDSYGQMDTLIDMEPIKVSAKRIRNSTIGTINKSWNTQNLDKKSINEILEEEGIFIKNYGLGNLATSSIRGGSSGHTLVLWEGLPIQNPMLGSLDLSLVKINAGEGIQLTKGGNTASWGSGAVSGLISIQKEPDFDNQIFLESSTTFGSFGRMEQGLKMKLGNSYFQSVSQVDFLKADNDFEYQIRDDLPKKTQFNSFQKQKSLLQDFYFKKKSNLIALHYWKQFSYREIPPTTTQNNNEAYQIDDFDRLILNWKYAKNKFSIQNKIGFFNENLDYFDPIYKLESKSNFKTLFQELSSQLNWNSLQITSIGFTYKNTTAQSKGYRNKNPIENKYALFINHILKLQKISLKLDLRQEMLNGKWIPFIPNFGLDYTPQKWFDIKFKVSKNYRLPTFNDRFWLPGGNPNLKAENGWSEEFSFIYKWNNKNLFFHSNSTLFNRNIKNWILWTPGTLNSFWSAKNIAEVWSRGIEQGFKFQFSFSKLNLTSSFNYSWIKSTNQITLINPSFEAGSQLLYTPIHQTNSKISIQYNSIQIALFHAFTGNSQGVNKELKAYHLFKLKLGYDRKFKKINSHTFLQINNLLGTSYYVVERRPMPGTHFQIGINFNYHKSIK